MAKLAGIPGPVLAAAREKLQELEAERPAEGHPIAAAPPAAPAQSDLFSAPGPHPVVEALEELDVDGLSPREALEKLYELKSRLK